MTPDIVSQIIEKSISIGVLLFVVIYFMKQIEKKDGLHTSTTNEFINLVKESNQVHMETKNAMMANTQKLETLHSDISQGRFCKTAK